MLFSVRPRGLANGCRFAHRAIAKWREAAGLSETGEKGTRRTPLSKKLRFEVFKRDGFLCQYCGAHPPKVVLECDHIHPVAEGGPDSIDNLVTSCFDCNRGKGDRLISDVPRSLSAKAAETSERETQISGYEAVMRERRERLDDGAYEVLGVFCEHFSRGGLPNKDFLSIRNFVEKSGVNKTLDSANTALAKKPYSYPSAFRYFCGVCWGKIRRAGGRCD